MRQQTSVWGFFGENCSFYTNGEDEPLQNFCHTAEVVRFIQNRLDFFDTKAYGSGKNLAERYYRKGEQRCAE